MPKKGHRAASRQAQLQRRKRHGKGHQQVFDPGPAESKATDALQEDVTEAELDTQPADELVQPAPRPARRLGRRASAKPAPSYSYLARELKRIGILSVIIVVVLAVLTVVLGN